MDYVVLIYSPQAKCINAWRSDTLQQAINTLSIVNQEKGPNYIIREEGSYNNPRIIRANGVKECPRCKGNAVVLDAPAASTPARVRS